MLRIEPWNMPALFDLGSIFRFALAIYRAESTDFAACGFIRDRLFDCDMSGMNNFFSIYVGFEKSLKSTISSKA